MSKKIYHFNEGDSRLVHLLGGKGAGLCEMTQIGLPVPPGFIITTEACSEYFKSGKCLEGTINQIVVAMHALEGETGRNFGSISKPLLVSVRSGAPVSMPGMLETILNVGLTKKVTDAFAKEAGKNFAFGCYDRLQENFKKITGYELPQEPEEQLFLAIDSVFKSAKGEKAVEYRRMNRLKTNLRTAVNVQQMVFGNMGKNSCTGVLFTRNPATGERCIYGEYLAEAQGEELVAGIRTPEPISGMKRTMPLAYKQLVSTAKALERHYKDMQDIEFTVQKGRLYILQTRSGKRTIEAGVKIAVDMAKEKLITPEDAVMGIDTGQFKNIIQERISPFARYKPIAKGNPTGPGIVSGRIALSPQSALEMKAKGEKVILVRYETRPDDIKGINAADGILTAVGGTLSHAAIVARSQNKCCITGCRGLSIEDRKLTLEGREFSQGDYITLNGTTGEILKGNVKTVGKRACPELAELVSMAGRHLNQKIAVFADSAEDIAAAKQMGIEAVVYRTEGHFFMNERLQATRDALLSPGTKLSSLEKSLEGSQWGYQEIFSALGSMPLYITLLSGTKQFLPSEEEIMLLSRLSSSHYFNAAQAKQKIKKVRAYKENPMLLKEIHLAQARAIAQAAMGKDKAGIFILNPGIYTGFANDAGAIFQSHAANAYNLPMPRITIVDSIDYHVCRLDEYYATSVALAQKAINEGRGKNEK